MGRKSKQKGSGYERKIAKSLTDWWGEGKFNRVPASGGLHWAQDQRVAGDIVPPPEADFPFVIECKKREGWTMDHILLNIGEPKDWWYQVVTDARRVNLTPLLIFSRNRAKDFIMAPWSKLLEESLEKYSKTRDWFITDVITENVREEYQIFKVIVTTLDTFQDVPIKDLKHYGKNVDWDPYADEYKE